MKRSQLEAFIEAIKVLREEASDQIASRAVGAYQTMKYDGSLIKYQTRIHFGDTIYMAKNDVWDLEINNPENAPGLWSCIQYREGYIIIPETITADMAFSYGDIGWWGDDLYRSIMPGTKTNNYNPEQYPAGWELLVREEAQDEIPEIEPEDEEAEEIDDYEAGKLYMTGDPMRYNGVVYRSKIDNNVWNPDQYPAGWEQE